MAHDLGEILPPTDPGNVENTQEKRKGRPRKSALPGDEVSPLPGGRASFAVTHDGRIDWERATPETREKLRRAFADPVAMRELGLTPGDAGTTVAGNVAALQVDAALIGPLYDGLSALFVASAKRAGYSEDAARIMAFTPEEKGALTPATAAVLNKYSGQMGQYAEEIMLATSVLMIVTVKWSTLKRTAEVVPFPSAPVPVPPSAT